MRAAHHDRTSLSTKPTRAGRPFFPSRMTTGSGKPPTLTSLLIVLSLSPAASCPACSKLNSESVMLPPTRAMTHGHRPWLTDHCSDQREGVSTGTMHHEVLVIWTVGAARAPAVGQGAFGPAAVLNPRRDTAPAHRGPRVVASRRSPGASNGALHRWPLQYQAGQGAGLSCSELAETAAVRPLRMGARAPGRQLSVLTRSAPVREWPPLGLGAS